MGWTDEQVKELRRLWDKGLTANEIAKKLGVTKNAIVGKVHRLCLKARPSPIKFKEDDIADEHTVVADADLALSEETAESVEPGEQEKDGSLKSNSCAKIKLIELDNHTCRWPIGDPRDEDFGFCGKKIRAGQTYCDEHSAMAYVKAIRR